MLLVPAVPVVAVGKLLRVTGVAVTRVVLGSRVLEAKVVVVTVGIYLESGVLGVGVVPVAKSVLWGSGMPETGVVSVVKIVVWEVT